MTLTSLIGDEFLKLRTVRTPWLVFAVAQVLIVAGIGGLIVGGLDVHAVTTSSKALGHVGLVSFLSLVLGILAVAGEYRHKTITDTYLTTPRRAQVLIAKLVSYSLIGLALGIASAITAVVTTAIWLASAGSSLDLTNPDLLRTLAGGIGWDTAFAAIGVGLGALIRNLTAAIAVALAWLALVEGVVGELIGNLRQWLPIASGVSLDRMGDKTSGLTQGTAAMVLLGYAVTFAALALARTTKSDVS